MARGEIGAVATTFDFYAGAVDKFHGQTIPGNARGTLMTFREPIGVCAAIVPWNFPMVILGWKVGARPGHGELRRGQAGRDHPADRALALADLAVEAGLPSGTFSVVTGKGSETGDALVRHPLVRKISFTGSTEVGTEVMRQAATGVKRVSLELGGKSANLIFADADLDVCIPSSLWSVYDNAGQDCCARSRILVETVDLSRSGRPVRCRRRGNRGRRSRRWSKPRWAPDHRPHIGKRSRAISRSADPRVPRSSTGGDRLDSPGNFLTPAVMVDVTPDMRVMKEEIFGPVVGIIPFDTKRKPWPWPTTPSTGFPGRCGPEMWAAPCGWRGQSKPG